MRHPQWPLSAVLALALLGVAGCGGGGDETTSTPTVATTPTATTLSKDELISQGDAICAEVNAAVGTVASSSAESAGRVSQEAALYSGMVERLKGLGAPEDGAGYSEFISAAEELAQAESDAKLAADRGDAAGIEAAESEVSSALASFQSAAQSYGFQNCGEGPSAPPASAGTAPPAEAEQPEGVEEEAAPEGEVEAEAEPAPETETGGAGSPEAGGGTEGGGATEESGGSSGGIGPG